MDLYERIFGAVDNTTASNELSSDTPIGSLDSDQIVIPSEHSDFAENMSDTALIGWLHVQGTGDGIRVFISQPMEGKTDHEILVTRAKLWLFFITTVANRGKRYVLLNNFIPSNKRDVVDDTANKNVYFLGLDLRYLSRAQVIIFADGWEKANGCAVEHDIVRRYIPNASLYYTRNDTKGNPESMQNWLIKTLDGTEKWVSTTAATSDCEPKTVTDKFEKFGGKKKFIGKYYVKSRGRYNCLAKIIGLTSTGSFILRESASMGYTNTYYIIPETRFDINSVIGYRDTTS